MNRRQRRARRAEQRQRGVPSGPYLHEVASELKDRSLEVRGSYELLMGMFKRFEAGPHRDTIYRLLIGPASHGKPKLLDIIHDMGDAAGIKVRPVAVKEVVAVLTRGDLTGEERDLLAKFVPEGMTGDILNAVEYHPAGARELFDAIASHRNGEATPEAPARFLGKKEPRLSDRILALPPRNSDEAGEQNHIRKAEKFVFDGDAMEKAVSAVKRLSHEDLSLAVSELRFPFRLSWFESGWAEATHGGNGGFVRGGFLIQTDETNQRGVFMFFGESETGGVTPVNMNIFFDFTAEWNRESPDPKDIVEKMSGQKTPRFFQSMETRNNVGPFFARFSFLAKQYEHQCASQMMTEMLEDIEVGHQLVAFLLTLAMPNDKVEITKDDFAEYNQSRLRLGLHKSQRQEYHVVRVNRTTYEPTAEAAAIMARVRQERGEPQGRTHASPGEHSVRTHRRVLRSGRVVWVKDHRRGSGECRTKRAGYEVPDFRGMTRDQAAARLTSRLEQPETVH